MRLKVPTSRIAALYRLAAASGVAMLFAWSGTAVCQSDDGSIGDYWEQIYQEEDVVEPTEVEQPSVVVQEPDGTLEDSVFLDHLFVRAGVDFRFNFAEFSNRATRTLITDGDVPLTVTPEGFVMPDVFDEYETHINTWAVAGTRGYLDSRFNTYFSAQYQRSDVDEGSIFQTFADAFGNGDYSQLINAYGEFTELGEEGVLNDTLVRFGRQYMFDTSPYLLGSAIYDGGMLRYSGHRLEAEVFAGRYVNAFSSPDDDFTAGISAGYEFLPDWWGHANYVKLQNQDRAAIEIRRPARELSGRGYVTFREADPTEVGLDLWYTPNDIPMRVQTTVIGRLNSQDFSYDMFRERDEVNDRLRMGTEDESVSVKLDADYDVNDWLTLGGTGIVKNKIDSVDAPYDNDFYEFSARAFMTPWDAWDFLFQYTYRDMDRAGLDEVLSVSTFDDISTFGETRYEEFVGDVYYRLDAESSINAGVYYSEFDARTRLALLRDSYAWGAYLRARRQFNQQLEGKLEYTFDRPDRDFFPELETQHTLLIGLEFRYN